MMLYAQGRVIVGESILQRYFLGSIVVTTLLVDIEQSLGMTIRGLDDSESG